MSARAWACGASVVVVVPTGVDVAAEGDVTGRTGGAEAVEAQLAKARAQTAAASRRLMALSLSGFVLYAGWMAQRGNCARCGESMDGDPIPGLPGRTTDLRLPIELTYLHRGITLVWRCPFCGFGWPRFPNGPMRDAAERHLRADEQAVFERPATGDAPARRPTPLPDVDPDQRVPQMRRAWERPPRPQPRGVHRDGGASLLPEQHES